MRKLMTIMAAFGCALALASCAGKDSDQKENAERPTAAAARPAATPPRQTPATATRTPVQIAACVTAGLTADHRKLAQARRLPVGAEVTINGAKERLAPGQSYWSRCTGPSLEERLAKAEADLAAARRELATAKRAEREAIRNGNNLLPWVYVDPSAGNDEANTWKYQAQKGDGFGWLSWLIALMLAGALAGLFFFGRDNQRLKKENADLRFQAPPQTRRAPESVPDHQG